MRIRTEKLDDGTFMAVCVGHESLGMCWASTRKTAAARLRRELESNGAAAAIGREEERALERRIYDR